MKLDASILRRVRGPLLAVGVVGCSSAPAAIAPEPPPPEPIAVAAAVTPIDPVSYDPASESQRFARLEAISASDEARRDRRIEVEEERARATRTPQGYGHGVGGIGTSNPNQVIYLDALCGRG